MVDGFLPVRPTADLISFLFINCFVTDFVSKWFWNKISFYLFCIRNNKMFLSIKLNLTRGFGCFKLIKSLYMKNFSRKKEHFWFWEKDKQEYIFITDRKVIKSMTVIKIIKNNHRLRIQLPQNDLLWLYSLYRVGLSLAPKLLIQFW